MSLWLVAFALTAQTVPALVKPPASPPAYDVGRGRPLKGSIAGLFSADDYPRDALDRGEEGTVGILLHIDPAGAVSGCDIAEPSGSATLDTATCTIATARARFEPARDAQGRPVASTYHQNIVWRISNTDQPSDPWSTRLIFALGSDGKPASCRVEYQAPGTAQSTNRACDLEKLLGAAPKLPPLPKNATSLIAEERFNPGPAAPLSLAANEILISRQVRSIDVDAAGKVTSCQLLEERGQESGLAPCADAFSIDYQPHKGADGRPVAFTATRTLNSYARIRVGTPAGKKRAP